MNLIFEDLNITHKEDVINILNYYIRETTSAYREEIIGEEHMGIFLNNENYCGYAIKNENDKVIGFATLEPYMPISTFCQAAEPMYFIHPDYTGKGAGTIVLNKLEDEARKREIKKLLADISLENSDSIKFHEKMALPNVEDLITLEKSWAGILALC